MKDIFRIAIVFFLSTGIGFVAGFHLSVLVQENTHKNTIDSLQTKIRYQDSIIKLKK